MARPPAVRKQALAQLALPLVLEASLPGKHHSWTKLITMTPPEQDLLSWQKTNSGLQQISELLSSSARQTSDMANIANLQIQLPGTCWISVTHLRLPS